ncbi:hypothetical protein [Collimonas fungivorans]|uniref:hypothetical protein n=1 Tax=Collimonas fungivorans TaxID=158899 RepID=UPI0012376E9D|nr:hypothetical protein [Collimonas fungivorans]
MQRNRQVRDRAAETGREQPFYLALITCLIHGSIGKIFAYGNLAGRLMLFLVLRALAGKAASLG